ncbi:MAG TPA: TonB-dependent receptor, partial [Chloroflexota bacterium]|nr:TonB-dependent receptor [Chloroflexota bacterium]
PGGPNQYDTTSPLCGADLEHLGLNRIPASYQPDSLWSYELGSKNEFLEPHSLINVAAFHTDWRRIQQQVTLPTCAFPFTGNVGAARIDGVELSAQSQLASHVVLGGSVTYVNSRITQSGPGVPAQVGQPLLDTPRLSGHLRARYEMALSDRLRGSAEIMFEYHGANLRQFSPLAPVTYSNGVSGEIPDVTQVQRAYHVTNVGFEVHRNVMHYRVYVDNLLDAAPYLDFRRPAGFSAADTLRPRTLGFGVRADY